MIDKITDRIKGLENLVYDKDYIDSGNQLANIISNIESDIEKEKSKNFYSDITLSRLTVRLNKVKLYTS